MKVLKRNKFFFYLPIIFLFYGYGNAANMRIAIDVPISLAKSFFGVEKYILQGYRSQHIFGINHHTKNAIKEENAKRAKNKKDVLRSRFSIQPQKNLYIVLCYVDEPNAENLVHEIKKALQEAVDLYKNVIPTTQLRFKALPGAYFVPKGLHEISIVQNVILDNGLGYINKLTSIIKNVFTKHKLKLWILDMGAHVNFVQIKSDDSQMIQLIKTDKKTLSHLASIRPQKGSDKGFDAKSEIHLYDGNKRLATYSLVSS